MNKEYFNFIEQYIYEGLKADIQKMLDIVNSGAMCSFDYLTTLNLAYQYLKINFNQRPDIEMMLDEIDRKNHELFKDSPLLVYGVDPEE